MGRLRVFKEDPSRPCPTFKLTEESFPLPSAYINGQGGGRSDHILAIGRVRVNKEVAGFQFKSSFAAALFMCQHGGGGGDQPQQGGQRSSRDNAARTGGDCCSWMLLFHLSERSGGDPTGERKGGGRRREGVS